MPDGIKNTQTKNTCRFFLVFGDSIFSSRRSLIQHVRLISYVSDLLLNALNPEIDFLFFRSLFTAKFNFCSEVFFLRFFYFQAESGRGQAIEEPWWIRGEQQLPVGSVPTLFFGLVDVKNSE